MAIDLRIFAFKAYLFQEKVERIRKLYLALRVGEREEEARINCLPKIERLLTVTPKKYRKRTKELLIREIFR